MADSPKVPYRTNAEPKQRFAPIAAFERDWVDAESLGDGWAIYQIGFLGLFLSVLAGAAWLPAGIAGAVGVGAYLFHRAGKKKPAPLEAHVDDAGLVVRFRGEDSLRVALDRVHDIVVDSSEIQRVTYHQAVGDPMPSTKVSGGVSVARLVARLDDGTTATLTRTATSYSECMETFGKLRVFLRSHGWKPVDER